MRISETCGHLRSLTAARATRDVRAAGGRALLALVLERAAHQRDRDLARIGARMREDEVLAAGLADEARVLR
jgi:hypothetical protein